MQNEFKEVHKDYENRKTGVNGDLRESLVAMEVYGKDVDFGMAQVVRIY